MLVRFFLLLITNFPSMARLLSAHFPYHFLYITGMSFPAGSRSLSLSLARCVHITQANKKEKFFSSQRQDSVDSARRVSKAHASFRRASSVKTKHSSSVLSFVWQLIGSSWKTDRASSFLKLTRVRSGRFNKFSLFVHVVELHMVRMWCARE